MRWKTALQWLRLQIRIENCNFGFFFFLGPLDVGFVIIFINLINKVSGVHYFYNQDETIVLYLAEMSSDLSHSGGGPGAGRRLSEDIVP